MSIHTTHNESRVKGSGVTPLPDPQPTLKNTADMLNCIPNLVTIEMLIKLYYTGEPKETLAGNSSQACRSAASWLIKNEMVSPAGDITDKGRAWVEHIKRVPIPVSVQSWQVPVWEKGSKHEYRYI